MVDPRTQAQFSLQRIYLKDLSFEAPGAPDVFLQEWQPQFEMQMDNTVKQIDPAGVYDVQLKVNVEAQSQGQVAFIIEVVQGGIFLISGFSDEQRGRITGGVCPDTLYPYAREAISSITGKASFPPFLLKPVNFDYFYQRRHEEAKLKPSK